MEDLHPSMAWQRMCAAWPGSLFRWESPPGLEVKHGHSRLAHWSREWNAWRFVWASDAPETPGGHEAPTHPLHPAVSPAPSTPQRSWRYLCHTHSYFITTSCHQMSVVWKWCADSFILRIYVPFALIGVKIMLFHHRINCPENPPSLEGSPYTHTIIIEYRVRSDCFPVSYEIACHSFIEIYKFALL